MGKSKDIEGLCEEKICRHQSMIWRSTAERSLTHTRTHTPHTTRPWETAP